MDPVSIKYSSVIEYLIKKKEYVLIMYIFQNGHKIKIKYTNLNWPKIKSGNLY